MERYGGETWTVANEFAVVRVSLMGRPGGARRLQVTDVRTGECTLLDPLELESLCVARHDSLDPFLDPSGSRWADRLLGLTPAAPHRTTKSEREV
jgi:hypothetical protein